MKKTLLIAVSAVIGLVVVAALGLWLFLDANQFRPQLESAIGGALGRKVALGNVKVALFSGGMTIDNLSISTVPEPSAVGFGLLCLAGIVSRRRR